MLENVVYSRVITNLTLMQSEMGPDNLQLIFRQSSFKHAKIVVCESQITLRFDDKIVHAQQVHERFQQRVAMLNNIFPRRPNASEQARRGIFSICRRAFGNARGVKPCRSSKLWSNVGHPQMETNLFSHACAVFSFFKQAHLRFPECASIVFEI